MNRIAIIALAALALVASPALAKKATEPLQIYVLLDSGTGFDIAKTPTAAKDGSPENPSIEHVLRSMHGTLANVKRSRFQRKRDIKITFIDMMSSASSTRTPEEMYRIVTPETFVDKYKPRFGMCTELSNAYQALDRKIKKAASVKSIVIVLSSNIDVAKKYCQSQSIPQVAFTEGLKESYKLGWMGNPNVKASYFIGSLPEKESVWYPQLEAKSHAGMTLEFLTLSESINELPAKLGSF